METQPVYVFAKWRIKQGQLENVLRLLGELSRSSRAEEGNLIYQIHQSNSDANTLLLYEAYADEEAQKIHVASAHFQSLAIGKIVPLLEEREFVLSSLIEL